MKKILATVSLMALTACQASSQAPARDVAMPHADYHDSAYDQSFAPSRHHKQLHDYVSTMIVRLLDHQDIQQASSIAVASFVDFDDSLTSTSMLGNQLAENFLVMLPQYGLTAIELKGRSAVELTSQGDLAFSRSQRRSLARSGHCCVLAGTLIYAPAGVEVYARVFKLSDQRVLASSKTTIPYFVVQHLGTPR
jgi:TolB-like protein